VRIWILEILSYKFRYFNDLTFKFEDERLDDFIFNDASKTKNYEKCDFSCELH
jgi:hypothetical protein